MGTRRGAAWGPFVWACVLAPLAACSCDDRLVEIKYPEPYVPPEFPEEPPFPGAPGSVSRGLLVLPLPGSGCDGAPLEVGVHAFGGVPPYEYRWDEDADLAATDVAVTVATGFGTKDFFATVTDAAGSQIRTRVTVARSGLPTPAIAFAAGALEVCDGTAVILDGSGSTSADGTPAASLAWDFDGDGVADATGPLSGALIPTQGQTVRLIAADATGCSDFREVTLGVRGPPVPAIEFRQGDERICPGEEIALDASKSKDVDGSPITNFAWDLDGDGTVDSVGPRPAAFAPALPATAILTVTDAYGCTATGAVQVSANPVPVADAGPDRQVAANGAIRLQGGASGGTPGYSFAWTPAASLDDPRTAQPLAAPRFTTTYTLAVEDAEGCTASDTVVVSTVGAVVVDAGADRLLCLDGGGGLTLAASASGGVPPLAYEWTANPPCGGCIADPTAPVTFVSPRVDTVFTFTARDANGTASFDTVAVTVRPGLTVDAGPDRRIERGEVTRLGTPELPGFDYRWTCDNWSCGLSAVDVAQPWAAPEGNTAYQVTLSDGDTCTGSDTVIVSMDSRVIATVPTEGYTPWPRDALIWVVFDADMDASTLNAANIRLIDPSDGTDILFSSIAYAPAARTLTLDPVDRQYWNNRPVVLVLKGGPSGIRTGGAFTSYLGTDFVLEFNASSNGDGRAPGIAYAQPAAFAAGVATTTDVVVRFDEPVDPRSVTPATFEIVGIPATVTYDPRTYTANLRTAADLAPNRTYTVRIAGVKDGPGNLALATWTFTTGPTADTSPPVIVGSSPAPGEAAFDVAGTVSITFDEPIDPATLDGFRLIDVSTGFPLSGEIVYDEATRTAVLDPHRLLEPDHDFRVEVAGIADQAGNPLAGTFAAPFTTQPVCWLERFENGVAGWNLAAPWALDFQAARYGRLGLTDSPAGNSPPNANLAATGPAFDVTGAASVALSFWNRRTMATTGSDAAVVEYSTNGTTWNQAPGGSVLQGPIGWRLQTFQLPTNGAPQMRVRFRLQTDASVNLDGWFVDEMVVR